MTETGADTPDADTVVDVPTDPAPLSWEDPPRGQAGTTAPVLTVDGFEGPLDWLLELARARKIDLAKLSILALVEAFAGAMDAALRRAPGVPAPDLERWAAWAVMAAQLTELRSRLLLPADAPAARAALAEAEALRRQWVLRTQMALAADWLEHRKQLGIEVFAGGGAGQGSSGGRRWTTGERRREMVRQGAGPARAPAADELGGLIEAAEAGIGHVDADPVPGGDLTDLLRACLVALQLPPNAQATQAAGGPSWSVRDAIARITGLLETVPEGVRLEAFLPAIADRGVDPVPQARAAVAATVVAALELSRSGVVLLEQEAPWDAILVRRPTGGSVDASPEPTEQGARMLA